MKFISRNRRKSKRKDITTMEWVSAETSKAYDEMTTQLNKVESAIFDPIEEAADTMADAADEYMSVSSDKPTRRRRIGAGGSASVRHHRRRRSRSKSMSEFLRPAPRPSRIRLCINR